MLICCAATPPCIPHRQVEFLLDENGQVLRKAILWCDGRTQQECDEITRIVGRERLIRITANPALTGFTAGKVLWVRRHEPEIWKQVRHILLPKDYVRFRLTAAPICWMCPAGAGPALCWMHWIWTPRCCRP